MKMRQTAARALMAVVMLFGASCAWAAVNEDPSPSPEAKIGEKMFASLPEAFASDEAKVAGVEIVLLGNVGLKEELDIVDFNGTLNLGGFTLTNDESFKASNYDWLIDAYVSAAEKACSLKVTNGTLTLKDGHMFYVCAGTTLTVAADAIIAEVGTAGCANPLRTYGKVGGHTGESCDIPCVVDVYGTVTRVNEEGNDTGKDNGVIDQCLGVSIVNVADGAVLTHAAGRVFKMSGGNPTVNIAGGTMTAGSDLFHAYASSGSTVNISGGTITMESLFSASGVGKTIIVNGLDGDCMAKFSTANSALESLDFFCADGFKSVKKGDWYVIRNAAALTVSNVKFQQRYPWNGKVDISFDVEGQDLVKLGVTVLTNGVEMGEAKTLEGSMELSLGDNLVEMNGVHLVWDAAKDLPAGFKSDKVKVKVAVEQIVSDYKVRYLEMGTDKELATTKVVKGAHVGRTMTEPAEVVENYTLTSAESQNLQIARDSAQNVITFYYQRTMTSYTVRYVDKNNPDKELATALTVKNVAAGITATCRAIEIEDFEVDGAMTQELLVKSDAAENVVTFYYAPPKSSYTVKYLEEGTEKVLSEPETVPDVEVGSSLTVNAKAIENYELVSESSQGRTIERDAAENVITFYYRRIMTSSTVRYVDKNDPDKELATAKTVNDVAAGTTVTCSSIEIEDYKVDGESTQKLLVKGDVSQNVVTFYYALATSGYKVQYINRATGLPVATEDVVTGCVNGSQVVVYPKEVEGFKPMQKQFTRTIEGGPDANVMIFIYYEYSEPL